MCCPRPGRRRLLAVLALIGLVPSCAHQREVLYPHGAPSLTQSRSQPELGTAGAQPAWPETTPGHKPLLNVID